MYELKRAQSEAAEATREKQAATSTILDMEAAQVVLVKEIEALQSAVETSKILKDGRDTDLSLATAAAAKEQRQSYLLRTRLVEADEEITRLRRKFEDAVEKSALERAALGKIHADQKQGRGRAKAPNARAGSSVEPRRRNLLPPRKTLYEETSPHEHLPSLLPPHLK